MNDILLELGQKRLFRQLVTNLGLPIPIPVVLRRAQSPMTAKPLEGRTVVLGKGPGAQLSQLGTMLADAGATVREQNGTAPSPSERVDALVFDGTGLSGPADLVALYDFFNPWMGSIAKNGRIVVIGRPPRSVKGAAEGAAQKALEGFTRSVSKELSSLGATANALFVEKGAEARVAGPLRFFLSDHSAYVNGQPLNVVAGPKTKTEPKWVRPLEGKVALVTGAARGIGEQIARLMASEGAKVVILDRPGEDELVNKLASELGGTPLLADITSPDAPETIAKALKEKHGGVDIVVHNAGITRDKTLRKMSKEAWELAVGINLGAAVRIDERLLNGVLRDNGRIVVLSSVSGIAGNRGQTNYSAAKSGLIAYVEHRAEELASRGITANAIAPGFIETRMTDAMPAANREVARRMNSLGQGGKPEDVAQAITFLSTPGAMGVSGNVLRVCGGMLIGA